MTAERAERIFGMALSLGLLASAGEARAAIEVGALADEAPQTAPLPVHVMGRALRRGPSTWVRQWPGTYFETGFDGAAVDLRVGAGEVNLRITVDGEASVLLTRPHPGTYRVQGFAPGRHRVRAQVVSESQAGPTEFGGFWAEAGTKPSPLRQATRQVEFIGDSHTVGYGNTASRRDCGPDQVWSTTDTSQGIAPRIASRYGADYQVNAISGRGIVRNYNGFAADTLPQAYPFTLFDSKARWADPAWRPQLVVIALGTNDFSTPLHAGEKWADRNQLRADYETSYAGFVESLRVRYPRAYFVLWATDLADGEIRSEVSRVVERLRRGGERSIALVPVSGLSLSACQYHPSTADDAVISNAISAYVDAHPEVWAAAGR
ncbi:SGNH/GDSL hydrolase family protein [Phenylobacterium montanum]|uniref:Endoglucanase E n=1 Tax=Phenylobacterium montanum TaxID=2823693 RepID=A0A975IX73_9CAUL|nr:SGNH/GDSL hydrolase family protein [Caulobacter sp. S6]QUD90329.1 endoglucanase E [Caulobacter sp. S6]